MILRLAIAFFYKIKPFASLVFLLPIFLLNSFEILGQNTSNEEIKRLQRAIFIYNFANQVGWSSIEEEATFKIGVLGPDRTIIDLKGVARNRTMFNKPIKIVRFQAVKDVSGVQVLYVNKKFNFDVDYILNKISGKQILLITEDYNFNSSMINMVNVDNSFKYEVNTSLLSRENFIYAPTLEKYAISSSEKWKELYKSSEKSLVTLRQEKDAQLSVLKEKEATLQKKDEIITGQQSNIEDKVNSLKEKNKWIEELWSENAIQKTRYEDKVQIERELEKNIAQQIEFIKIQQKQIDSSNLEINVQNDLLQRQRSKISEKEQILKEQNIEIDAQKKINILLLALASIILIGSFFIYRGYLAKKKLSNILQEKNEEIELQTTELAFKNNELEQFAYIASHDLQEPLNTITSLINLLQQDYRESFNDEGKESLNYIKDSSSRMKGLINALLRHSRLGSMGSTAIVDCDQVVINVTADLNNIITETKTELYIEDLPNVTGSEDELRMVFQNLITNSIKFKSPNVPPKIDISCEKTGVTAKNPQGYWEFSVEDNGIGISDIHKERIFAIFQRLHSREAYEGTGIGLAHTKKIIEAHGGRIWVESEEGIGSTFYFTIPA